MREQAEKDYMQGMKYKDIAAKYGVSINTVKSWKQRHKWNRKKAHTESEKGAHKKQKGCTQNKRPRGAPKGNKNAVGHGAPEGNKNAEKHGFFAKIFPDDKETQAIIEEIQVKSPLEILWEQIVIQYTAIARGQKLMWVRDQEDKTIEKVGYSKGNVTGEKWEVQQAWDKHANFLTAQSRAIKTLESLINRYEKLLVKDLETEEQQLRIETLKAQLEKMKNPDGGEADDWVKAIEEVAAQRRKKQNGGDEDE